MPDPLRVYIAGLSATDRVAIEERIRQAGWRLVNEPAWADLVLTSPEEWQRRAPRRTPTPDEDALEALTPREREVLRLVAEGLHNREIGERLGVTEHTVKFHLAAVFGKLGVSTRAEAVQKGVRLGYIDI